MNHIAGDNQAMASFGPDRYLQQVLRKVKPIADNHGGKPITGQHGPDRIQMAVKKFGQAISHMRAKPGPTACWPDKSLFDPPGDAPAKTVAFDVLTKWAMSSIAPGISGARMRMAVRPKTTARAVRNAQCPERECAPGMNAFSIGVDKGTLQVNTEDLRSLSGIEGFGQHRMIFPVNIHRRSDERGQ